MKKIGLITYHGADNYGSLLQSYALLRTLNNLAGMDAELVNFISDEQKEMYSLFFPCNSVKNLVKNAYVLLQHYNIRKEKIKLFDAFREQYLGIEKKNSFSVISDENVEKYEVLVCGSDQIWNIRIKDFYDYYMLSFSDKAKKISYAASMGGVDLELKEDEKKKIGELLKDFSAISVRENICKSMIQECTDKEVVTNIDPVFLLERNEWDKIAKGRIVQQEYIFFYSVDYNEDSVRIAKWYAQKYNLPVYVLHTSWKSYVVCKEGMKWAEIQGIEDFISLIKYAKFVISGSFHGTAFSILYNKPFFRVQKRKNDTELIVDDRIRTLFEKLQISDREINIFNYKEMENKLFDIDYSRVNELIKKERQFSIDYIENAVKF